MQFGYKYGEWVTAVIVLDSLANTSSISSTLIDLDGAAGVEWEFICAGTASATAYCDVVWQRAASNGTDVSSFDNAKPLNSVFLSATPAIATRYNEMSFSKGKFGVKNNTGAGLAIAGNSFKYRLVYPISLSV